MTLDAHDWALVDRALHFVLVQEFTELRRAQPKAAAWHTGWAEFRQRTVAQPCGDHVHYAFEADFTMVFRNEKTNKCKERVLFRGTGESSFEAVRDAIMQLTTATRSLIARAPDHPIGFSRVGPDTYPIFNMRVLHASPRN